MERLWSLGYEFLCVACVMRFQVEGDIFTNLLNGSTDKHVAGDFHASESGRIDASLNRIIFVDVEAHRPVWKADGVECVIVSHGSGV
jgi:hypothetical protein